MDNHNASPQALGYLYQVQCALLFLLNSEDEDIKVCIEKFDDISFHKDQNVIEQLQLKYHSKDGNITNSSVDFWRTLKVWIDAINVDVTLLDSTKFYIITTNSIATDSVIEKIKKVNKNGEDKVDEIYNELRQIANDGLKKCDQKSQSHKFYSAFINFQENRAKSLIKSIVIIPDFYQPSEINACILRRIRPFTLSKTEHYVFETLTGWWYGKMILCLQNPQPTFISFNDLRLKVSTILSDLSENTLPIDVTEKEITALASESNVQNILKQMQLIKAKKTKISNAVQSYYRAYAQRSKWIKDTLIYSDELDEYDERLNREWEFQFNEITDDLEDNSSEEQKVNAGKELYKKLMDKDIPIRPNFNDNTISRGSLNGLSNELKVGWHPDYKKRILGGED